MSTKTSGSPSAVMGNRPIAARAIAPSATTVKAATPGPTARAVSRACKAAAVEESALLVLVAAGAAPVVVEEAAVPVPEAVGRKPVAEEAAGSSRGPDRLEYTDGAQSQENTYCEILSAPFQKAHFSPATIPAARAGGRMSVVSAERAMFPRAVVEREDLRFSGRCCSGPLQRCEVQRPAGPQRRLRLQRGPDTPHRGRCGRQEHAGELCSPLRADASRGPRARPERDPLCWRGELADAHPHSQEQQRRLVLRHRDRHEGNPLPACRHQ